MTHVEWLLRYFLRAARRKPGQALGALCVWALVVVVALGLR